MDYPLEITSKSPFIHSRHRKYLWGVIALASFFILLAFRNSSRTRFAFFDDKSVLEAASLKRTHVAVASDFGVHFDVHLPVAMTIHDILGEDANVQVFAHLPFRFGFQEIVDALHLYDKPIQSPDNFMEIITSGSPYPNEPDQNFDLIVLGTCEIDMRRWSNDLVSAWDALPLDQKFKLVCIVHNFHDQGWHQFIPPWAERGALRLLPLGYHVGRTYLAHFKQLADNPDPKVYNAMYEYVDIDVHAPVLDVPEYGTRRAPGVLSKAVIQGSFQTSRRDYPNIFRDLASELERDASAWGYMPLSYDRDIFEPIFDEEAEPFKLYLIGEGEIEIPKAISKVVVIQKDLNYTDFYAFMQSMDVVIPAFVNHEYYDTQASSTVAMAVECSVPILASRRMREAYGYIDDDRVVITRPQALREIPAIGVLRAGRYTSPRQSGSDSALFTNTSIFKERFLKDVDEMIHRGWRRSLDGYRGFRRELWEKNRAAVRRIMADLPGEINEE